MDSIRFLEEYENALHGDSQMAKLFEDKLGWIHSRKDDWKDDKIRVGIIGDTSSGKSTMINAILGMDILSSAVVPSSGVLVCCTYGIDKAIIIHFKDGPNKVYKGDDVCQKNLIKYSDERHNPQNKHNVATIELQTPTFELGKDVLLIDSPGLNAYGLEAHEKITLETMVPTIDYCIYVTTTKTTSDAHACEVLDVVGRYKCPIMMIQNKLDAVREAPGGKKTKQQVAKEHYERLKKVVSYSSIPNKDSVDVIQISAINALKWRTDKNENRISDITFEDYKASQFDLFMITIKKRLEDLRPLIEQVRIVNLYDSLHEVTSEVIIRLDSMKAPENNLIKIDYDKKIKEIDNFIESKEAIKKEIVDRFNDDFNVLKNDVNSKINENNAKSFVIRTNQKVNLYGNKIYEFIKSDNTKIQRFCGYVHIPGRDLYRIPDVLDYQKIDLKFCEEDSVVRQKQTGIGGLLNRFTGLFTNETDKGYEYVNKKVKKIDVEAVKIDVFEIINNESERYKKILSNWNSDCVSVCEIVKNILITEKKKFNERQEIEIEKKKLKDLYYSLYLIEKNLGQFVGTVKVWKAKEQIFNPDIKEVNVDELSGNVLKLSSEIKKIQNNQVMRSLVKLEKLDGHVPILMGWDENCENHFDWNAGISDLKIIHLIEEEPPKERDGVETCFFVLVNSSQIGMEKKKVKNIRLSEIVEPNDFVVWVVQDFEELSNSGGIEEGLRNMLWLREFSEICCRSIVWINHDNPIYNISFIEQQYNPKNEIAEQQEYLDYLRMNYPVYCDEFSIGLIAKSIMKVRA